MKEGVKMENDEMENDEMEPIVLVGEDGEEYKFDLVDVLEQIGRAHV